MGWKNDAIQRVKNKIGAANTDEVAAHCGVSRTTLFRWAKSEEGVPLESSIRIALFLAENDPVLAAPGKVEGLAYIEEILEGIIEEEYLRDAAITMLNALITR